jgi:hypothetical protein
LFKGEAVDVEAPMLQLLAPDRPILAAMLPVVLTDCDCTERLAHNRIARVRNDFRILDDDVTVRVEWI